jgi:hypothetical protein
MGLSAGVMERAFSPCLLYAVVSWGVAPGYRVFAPLALCLESEEEMGMKKRLESRMGNIV